jgi:M6 family metalloprotease-like protein
MKYLKILLITFICILTSNSLYAVPAYPHPIVKTLPDGSTITIKLRGNEHFKYTLSEDGYLIKQAADGFFYFQQLNESGEQTQTNIRVKEISQRSTEERKLISTLKSFPDLSQSLQGIRARKVASSQKAKQSDNAFPLTGSPKSLVILVNFKDLSFVTSNPATAFYNLLNEVGYSANGGTGSARDYFRASSNGMSNPEFVVVGPYTLPNNMEYYGKNDNAGDDENPRQMVIDACKSASQNGVNFADYDTDADGNVDNVFIYYAGHNEAEGAATSTVWPHRWSLSSALRLNGKYIFDYACTSELRGSTGRNMCGIGTFCHEFGHVYGLTDYYPTDGGNHHTLSDWNIMDEGPYLNQGRTPPTYSAYERFYLGWLTPVLLKSATDGFIPDLKDSNKAYLITQTGNHNLNGANPNPVEFFLLENRQKKGWDAYIPNSGMLATRIYYNRIDWDNNSPNNNASMMGVDIMEADNIASSSSLKGDAFPGTSNVTTFNPVMRSGTNINKPVTNINLTNGLISFKFMGGGVRPLINTDVISKLALFSTSYGKASETIEFGLSGKNIKDKISVSMVYNQHFEVRIKGTTTWSKSLNFVATNNAVDTTTIQIRYNPTEPSMDDTHHEQLLFSTENELLQVVLTAKSSKQILVVPPLANEATDVSLAGYKASWNKVFDATGYYITAYNVSEGESEIHEGFNNGVNNLPGWTIMAGSAINNSIYAGDSVPSIQFRNSGEYIQTENYLFPVSSLSFFVKSIAETFGVLKVEGIKDNTATKIADIVINASLDSVYTYNFTSDQYRSFKFTYFRGNGSLAIDDIRIKLGKRVEYDFRNSWTTESEALIKRLIPDRKYYYYVQASDRTLNSDNTLKYENITLPSNIVEVNSLLDSYLIHEKENKKLSIITDDKKNAVLNLINLDEKVNTIFIYTSEGRLYQTFVTADDALTLNYLPSGRVYIIKAGGESIKFVK